MIPPGNEASQHRNRKDALTTHIMMLIMQVMKMAGPPLDQRTVRNNHLFHLELSVTRSRMREQCLIMVSQEFGMRVISITSLSARTRWRIRLCISRSVSAVRLSGKGWWWLVCESRLILPTALIESFMAPDHLASIRMSQVQPSSLYNPAWSLVLQNANRIFDQSQWCKAHIVLVVLVWWYWQWNRPRANQISERG